MHRCSRLLRITAIWFAEFSLNCARAFIELHRRLHRLLSKATHKTAIKTNHRLSDNLLNGNYWYAFATNLAIMAVIRASYHFYLILRSIALQWNTWAKLTAARHCTPLYFTIDFLRNRAHLISAVTSYIVIDGNVTILLQNPPNSIGPIGLIASIKWMRLEEHRTVIHGNIAAALRVNYGSIATLNNAIYFSVKMKLMFSNNIIDYSYSFHAVFMRDVLLHFRL